jgi:hypothetical protein
MSFDGVFGEPVVGSPAETALQLGSEPPNVPTKHDVHVDRLGERRQASRVQSRRSRGVPTATTASTATVVARTIRLVYVSPLEPRWSRRVLTAART